MKAQWTDISSRVKKVCIAGGGDSFPEWDSVGVLRLSTGHMIFPLSNASERERRGVHYAYPDTLNAEVSLGGSAEQRTLTVTLENDFSEAYRSALEAVKNRVSSVLQAEPQAVRETLVVTLSGKSSHDHFLSTESFSMEILTKGGRASRRRQITLSLTSEGAKFWENPDVLRDWREHLTVERSVEVPGYVAKTEQELAEEPGMYAFLLKPAVRHFRASTSLR